VYLAHDSGAQLSVRDAFEKSAFLPVAPLIQLQHWTHVKN
jgi:hypothetical protein